MSNYIPCHIVRGDKKRGGGITAWVHERWNSTLVNMDVSIIEYAVLEIKDKSQQSTVTVVYNPDFSHHDFLFKTLDQSTQSDRGILIRDFNVDLLSANANKQSTVVEYLNLMNNHRYFLCNPSLPTRVTDDGLSATLIDHIAVKDLLDNILVLNCYCSFSNHNLLLISVQINKGKRVVKEYSFNKISYFSLNRLLENKPIHLKHQQNIKLCFGNFSSRIGEYIEKVTTRKKMRVGNKIQPKPWMNEQLLVLAKRRNCWQHKYERERKKGVQRQ